MRSLLLAILIAPSATFAVEYTLPSDGGWYQLQSQISGETFCESGSIETCDIASGTAVKLVNHSLRSSDPSHIQNFTIEADAVTSPIATGFQVIYQPATETDVYTGGEIQTRVIPCPADTIIIGGSCLFESGYGPSSDGTIYPMESEQSFDGNALRCTILGTGYNTQRYLATFNGTAVCAVGESTTLPVIVIR